MLNWILYLGGGGISHIPVLICSFVNKHRRKHCTYFDIIYLYHLLIHSLAGQAKIGWYGNDARNRIVDFYGAFDFVIFNRIPGLSLLVFIKIYTSILWNFYIKYRCVFTIVLTSTRSSLVRGSIQRQQSKDVNIPKTIHT